MKFRVNDGQKIPYFENGQRGIHEGGAEVEGPAWWAKEFEGRMTPIDDKGKAMDPKIVADAAPEFATASKAHEKAGLLREMAKLNPGLADILLPQAEALEAEAEKEVKAGKKSGHDAAPVAAMVVDAPAEKPKK